MSASKVVNSTRQQQRTGGRNSNLTSLNNQQPTPPHQTAMAEASASRSLEADVAPVYDNESDSPPPPKVGYQVEIFDKEDERHRFSCGFCEKILREPMQAHCGHRFCKDCQKAAELSVKRGNKVICQNCKDEDVPEEESVVEPEKMFSDRGFKREMVNLRTKCPNEPCAWQGLFKDYVKHEEECVHQPLVCEKCGERVSKNKLAQHREGECAKRVVKCEHCHADILFDHKKNHVKDCLKFPESCSQCSRSVPRDKMRKHQSQDCPNRMVTCPIDGCSGPQQHSRFSQHVQKDQVKHLSWVLGRIHDLDETLASLSPHTLPSPSSPQASANPASAGASHTLDGVRERLEQLERQVRETMGGGRGSTGGGGRGGEAGGQASNEAGAGASAGNVVNAVERVNAMEFKVNSLEPILSVLHGEMNRCIGAIEALEARLMRETRTAEEFRRKMEQHEGTLSTLSASVSQREAKMRELEGRVLSLGQDLPDGTMLWRIPNFSQVRREAVSGTMTNIHSRAFYTGSLGYKMCVRLYPNGDGMGRGTHLSLFFSLMRSNNDALLPWPFKQKVYFMLIDQNNKKHVVDAFRSEPTSSSFQRPTSEMNIATGCPMFVQLNKLTQPGHGYIKDDTMYIRVVVETDGIEEHLKQFDPRSMPLTQ